MRHITWVPLLAALSAIAAMVFLAGGASARTSGCPGPCYFPNINVPLQWVPAGKTTVVTVVANATYLPKVVVSLPKHSSLLSLVKSRSTKYVLVKGVPTWSMYRVHGQKSVHFVFLVRKTVPAGKRMPFDVKTATVIGGKLYTTYNKMALHVAPPQ